jgi:ubiquinone/menaquinone biosynthesis C-methylase UbiE
MQFVDQLIGRQIRRPSGVLGYLLGHLMASDHGELTNWTLDQLSLQDHDNVLDVGCGSGLAVKRISAVVTQGHVVGIDYSPAMLRQATRRNRHAIKAGRVEICSSSVSTLPFDGGSFDKVCAIETFYFWPNPSEDLREVARVLKPGGIAAFAMDISKEGVNRSAIADTAQRLGLSVYSGQEMNSLLSQAGFIDVSFKAIPARGKGWLCAVGRVAK